MRVLVAFECSGAVRRAFRALGHEAWSCDLKPAEDGGEHLLGDVRAVLDAGLAAATWFRPGWDLVIAHPSCQYLCSSGLHWNSRVPGRAEKTEEALGMVRWLMGLPVPRLVIENPHGRIGTAIRKADQTVQPYQFGDDASKATALWLKGLPLLTGTKRVPGRMVEWPKGSGRMVERWANQTDSGQNRLGPSPTRAADRARTYPGIAAAMADQWGAPRPAKGNNT